MGQQDTMLLTALRRGNSRLGKQIAAATTTNKNWPAGAALREPGGVVVRGEREFRPSPARDSAQAWLAVVGKDAVPAQHTAFNSNMNINKRIEWKKGVEEIYLQCDPPSLCHPFCP